MMYFSLDPKPNKLGPKPNYMTQIYYSFIGDAIMNKTMC
jgi:hypothetical protein